MTVKKSLDNRIRGWLPKDPLSIGTSVKINVEPKQQPIVIPSGFNLSATTFAGISAVIYTFLALFFTRTLLTTQSYIIHEIVCIIVGLAVGILTGYMSIQSQLCRLSRSYKIGGMNKKEFLLFNVSILTIAVSSFLFNSSFNAIQALNLSLLSVYMVLLPYMPIRFLMFQSYEKKENMRIMQDWMGPGLIVIPKPPKSEMRV
jgi:hypothetical protein